MTHFDPGGSKGSGKGETIRAADDTGPTLALPAAAQRTLDEIADALGVTTALLEHGAPPDPPRDAESAGLVEAATLLRAFVTISDPVLRRRCIVFVQDAAEQGRARR